MAATWDPYMVCGEPEIVDGEEMIDTAEVQKQLLITDLLNTCKEVAMAEVHLETLHDAISSFGPVKPAKPPSVDLENKIAEIQAKIDKLRRRKEEMVLTILSPVTAMLQGNHDSTYRSF